MISDVAVSIGRPEVHHMWMYNHVKFIHPIIYSRKR